MAITHIRKKRSVTPGILPLEFTPEALEKSKSLLPPLSKKKYPHFAIGSQSIVLQNEPHHVLIITSHSTAQKIEIVRSTLIDEKFKANLAIPTLVGINESISQLLVPNNPHKKQDYKTCRQNILTHNIVYELPKYDGTLDDLLKKQFEEDSIENLKNTLTKALKYLHDNGITHGDIAKRNIFYTGTYPDFKFFLADFGSVSNERKTFQERSKKDLYVLENLLSAIEKEVKQRSASLKITDINDTTPLFRASLRNKRGLRPLASLPRISPDEEKKLLKTPPTRKKLAKS